MLLPDDPFAKSKLTAHYYLLNYLELGQASLVVGGVQKSFYQHLSAGNDMPAHLQDSRAFCSFLKEDGARQVSDLVSRLTHESHKNVENQPVVSGLSRPLTQTVSSVSLVKQTLCVLDGGFKKELLEAHP